MIKKQRGEGIVYSSAIRQKGESQNRGNKKTKHSKFSEKLLFLTPWDTCVYVSWGKKCFFFGKFGVFFFSCYLCFEIRPFALSQTYWTINNRVQAIIGTPLIIDWNFSWRKSNAKLSVPVILAKSLLVAFTTKVVSKHFCSTKGGLKKHPCPKS